MADNGLMALAQALTGSTSVEEGVTLQQAAANLKNMLATIVAASPTTATISGTLNSQASAAGVGNGADTTDDTLFTFTLPANTLSANAKGIYVYAFGSNGATGNNKTVKLFFGSQTIVTSGVITTNTGAWSVEAYIFRTAAATEQIDAYYMNGGALSVQTQTAGTQDTTAAAGIVIKVTGASPTTGAASDIVGNGFLVQTIF